MTTPDTDKMLNRIRALLAQAEHPNTGKAEAEAFTAKAAELMAKYGIDRALLAATQPDSDKVGDRIVVIPAPYAMPKLLFLDSIASALGAKGVRRNGAAAGTQELHLFGMESDLERIEILWTSLLVQAARAQSHDFDRDNRAWSQPKKWKADWMAGYTNKVAQRLREAEDRAKQNAAQERAEAGDTGPSVALVLVKRSELVDRRRQEAYPKLRFTKSRRTVGAGYGSGQRAGARADLGGTRLGAGRQAAFSR